MVTANRKNLAKRAVNCYLNQTYPNKELVIIDDGDEDYTPILKDIPSKELRYIKIPKKEGQVLGSLRNLSLEKATGDYLVQWDDDDWYHPERISIQAKVLDEGFDACCIFASLMHLDDSEYFYLPYIGSLSYGIPGSIMHKRNDSIRYPEMRRAEDKAYLNQWRNQNYTTLDESHAGLFIRCYHGSNTWEQKHFKRRMRNNVIRQIKFFYYKNIIKDLKKYSIFQLSEPIQQAFEMYLKESSDLNLFKHRPTQ